MIAKRSPSLRAIRALAPVIVIGIVLAVLAPSIVASLDEETQSLVLVQAIPFFCAFVAILLSYILVIVLLMIRFGGHVPHRVYAPVDRVITIGILAGIFFLFQPFWYVAYRYGFLVLLAATLLFIVWSHVIPRGPKADRHLPPISRQATVIGLAAAAVVFVVLLIGAAQFNQPTEPYGIRQRLWNSYDEAQRTTIAEQAQQEYNQQIVPFLLILNLGPAALVFFSLRGVIDGWQTRKISAPKRERSLIEGAPAGAG